MPTSAADTQDLPPEQPPGQSAGQTHAGNRAQRRGHLSPEQLAEREGVPVATVYRWRSQRTGPPGFRAGRHVRYRLADVVAWEERQIADDSHGAA